MILTLSISLLERLGLIIIFAFFISKTVIFKNYIIKTKSTTWENLFFAILWGSLGIFMTQLGTPVLGGIANSRTIPIVLAGLFGGPTVGAISGLIAGLHRAFFVTGGDLTALSCGISTLIGGLIGGFASKSINQKKSRYIYGFLLGLLVEVIQMLLILLIARPFDQALMLVKVIFAPMTILNAIGIGMFLLIVEQIYEEHEKAAAMKAQLALEIANATLPYLKKGLTFDTADHAAKIIKDVAGYSAVSFTSNDMVLSHVGSGEDHHKSGGEIWTKITRIALSTGELQVSQSKDDIGCYHEKCQLRSVVVTPLIVNDKVVGAFKIYKDKENGITMSDQELAKGLGVLFSTQLELSNLEQQKHLREVAELKALRAQIKPHFLFNSLNTIMSLIRTNADEARILLQELSLVLRSGFRNNDPLISLKEELRLIEAFLRIEKARFPDKLTIVLNVCECKIMIPPLLIQPLVENAVKHGILKKNSPGTVSLTVTDHEDYLLVIVEDDGIGMSEETMNHLKDSEGVGLKNVIQRLKTIYTEELNIQSQLGQGTKITFSIPKKGDLYA